MQPISLHGITKSFGKTRALADIDLAIGAGERLVLIGGSGAGKTTLLRILAGLENPDCGLVRCGDRDITLTPAHQRGIAMLSQDYAIYPHLTIERNLRAALEPLRLAVKDRDARIASALEWFELEDLRQRRPAQLSGGQLQRAALAKAIVRRPQVLVLDEPLSQLDLGLREQSRQLILSMTQQFETTLVMVTHDPLDALRMADRLAVLENGILVQVDAPQDVYRYPKSRAVAELLSPFGINDLVLTSADPNLTSQRICFRPEAAALNEPGGKNATANDVLVDGLVQQVQFLGFASLAFIAVTQPGAVQVIRILLNENSMRDRSPELGQHIRVRISMQETLAF